MAELHDETIRRFRKKLIKMGFKEKKSPMPDFRPDFFGQKLSEEGGVIEEVAVEAEIESTLYSEHTSSQLVKMDEYIKYRKKRKIKVSGCLLVPRGNKIENLANELLESLFQDDVFIKVKIS